MKKKILSLSLVTALMLTLISGCDNATNSGEIDDVTENTDIVETVTEATETDVAEVSAAPISAADYEWGNVEIVGGGYTSGIYYNPSEEGLIYARTDIGGAYRMDKESGEWVPLCDQYNESEYALYGIDGLVTDSIEPNKLYLLAGMYSRGELEMRNAYVLRSDDYGATFEMTELEFAAGGNEPNRFADRLVIDPVDNSTLYVGSRSAGLWVSHDSGVSFSKIESFPTNGLEYKEDGYNFGITAIAPVAATSENGEACKTIYVGTGDKMSYVTNDGGETWQEIEGQPKNYLAYHIDVVDEFIYFTYGGQAGPYQVSQGAIKRYTPATGEWLDITPDDSGHGWGDLAIDPNNHQLMYVSTMGKWGGNENDNIFRSTDGGATWDSLFTGDGNDRIFRTEYAEAPWLDWGSDTAKLGWMIGCLALNPFNSDEIMYGTGATIFCSENLTKWGEEELVFKVRCKGLEETAVLGLEAANSDEIRLYSALGDIDGFAHTDVETAPANLNDNGHFSSATDISAAFQNPDIVARAGNDGKAIGISQDGGKTWNYSMPREASGQGGNVEVNSDGSAIYWTNQQSVAVFVTTDFGETWTKLEKSFANPELETDKFNPDIVYVFGGGYLYISKDKGATFEMSSLPVPEKSVMVSDPENEGVLWLASAYGGIFKITDFGTGELAKMGMQTAENLAFGAARSEGEPMAMYSLGVNNSVYGCWISIDGGTEWYQINDDDHEFGVIGETLAADYRIFGNVYFGTNGRGIIMGKIKTNE